MGFLLRTGSVCLLAVLLLATGSALAVEPSSRVFPLASGRFMDRWPAGPYGDVEAFPDGSVLVTRYLPRLRLDRIDVAGNRTRIRIPVPDGDFRPQDVLPLPDGSVIYANEDRIWRIAPDGSVRVLAGAENDAPPPEYAGEDGPAVDAVLRFPRGLAVDGEGNLLFSDWDRVLRVSRDGRITTLAGSGLVGFSGDGGRAVGARLDNPTAVLLRPAGAFAFIDSGNRRVREVTADRQIRTLAGNGEDLERGESRAGDGGPAVDATIGAPRALAGYADGTLVIGGFNWVRSVDPEGVMDTLVDLRSPVRRDRVGDFAGRNANPVDGMAVTPEGGLVISAVEAVRSAPLESRVVERYGSRQVVLYVAPRNTARTLVAMRDARASSRRITAVFDATQAGTARVDVRQDGRDVASSTRQVSAGRGSVTVRGRFARETYDVTLTLTRASGEVAQDAVSLFAGTTLAVAHLRSALTFHGHEGDPRCRRISRRRVDCQIWRRLNFGVARRCVSTLAYELASSGVLFARAYRKPCSAYRFRPNWRGNAWYVPALVAGG